MTQDEAILDLTTTPHAAVYLTTEAPITTDVTHHTVGLPLIEVSLEVIADQGHTHPINTTADTSKITQQLQMDELEN